MFLLILNTCNKWGDAGIGDESTVVFLIYIHNLDANADGIVSKCVDKTKIDAKVDNGILFLGQ